VELIGIGLLAVLGLLGAAVSRQLTDEFKAWTPRIIESLIRHAVRKLPDDQRERFGEEWRSHINETPGEIGKFVVAISLPSASRKMSKTATIAQDIEAPTIEEILASIRRVAAEDDAALVRLRSGACAICGAAGGEDSHVTSDFLLVCARCNSASRNSVVGDHESGSE
jgi:hypothetical protein